MMSWEVSGMKKVLIVLFLMVSICGCQRSVGTETEAEPDASVDSGSPVDCRYEIIETGPVNADPFNIEDAVCREDGWCWHWPYPTGAVLYGGTVDGEGNIYAVGYNGTILKWPIEGKPSILGRGETAGHNLWTSWKAHDGTLWVGGHTAAAQNSPAIFKYKDGVLEKETDPVVELVGEDHGFIHRIKGNEERLWAVGVKGYYGAPPQELDSLVLYLENDTWHDIGTPYDESTIINDLAFSPSGEVWFALAAGNILVYDPSNDSWRIVTPDPMHPWARIWWKNGELYVYALDGVFARMNEDETFVELGRVPFSYQPRPDFLAARHPFLTPAYVDEKGTLTVHVNEISGYNSIWEVSEEKGAERIFGPADVGGYLVAILKKQGESYVGFGSKGYTFSFSKESGYKDIYRIPPWDQHSLSLWEQGEDVVGVTGGGHLIRFDGTQWETISKVPGLSDDTMYRSKPMWANESCLYVAVERGEIYRYKDSEWEALPYEGTGEVRDICGLSCDEVYVTTWGGVFFRLNDSEWEEISTPVGEVFRGYCMWCKPSGKVYVSGAGLYLWEGDEWTVVIDGEISEGNLRKGRFIWGHENDDTLYWGQGETDDFFTLVRQNGEWKEWRYEEVWSRKTVRGVRGFDLDTIWGFAHQRFAVRPGNGKWEPTSNVLFSQPADLFLNGREGWVTREGMVFSPGQGLDISFLPSYGMTVKNPE